MVNSILFKFAIDSNNMFNGDIEKSSKMAGSDLQGLINYFNCNITDLHLPMSTIIDYFGFRGI